MIVIRPRPDEMVSSDPSRAVGALAFGDPLEGGLQPEVVERWRPHADCQRTKVGQRSARDVGDFSELLACDFLFEVALEHVQSHEDPGHRVRGLLVQVMSDIAPLGFLALENLVDVA
jgi:hypothetical protein